MRYATKSPPVRDKESRVLLMAAAQWYESVFTESSWRAPPSEGLCVSQANFLKVNTRAVTVRALQVHALSGATLSPNLRVP